MIRRPTEATPAPLRRYSKFVVFWTLFTIFAGAMVTSTGSGLAVPDWPLSYGMLMPPMVGGIFYEHGHRIIATTVGLFAVIHAIWLHFREPKQFVRTLGWAALGLVLVQGLLGGLTVLHLLPLALSMSHAFVAEVFLCVNVAIAFFTSRSFARLEQHEKGEAPVAATTGLVALVGAQILVGALMRHLGAGLAISGILVVPPFSSTAVVVNFAHRVGGILVALAAIALAITLTRYERNHPLRLIVNFLVVFVIAQVALGVYTILSGKQPHITSLHVVLGAMVFATSVVLALTARTVAWRAQSRMMTTAEAAA